MKKILFYLFFLFTAVSVYAQKFPSPEDTTAAPDSFKVLFETTKGNFVVQSFREWSPFGVDRFFHLVQKSYFDSLPIFRVVPNFVAQFGIANNEIINSMWDRYPIKDEPVKASNTKGVLAYARSGPDTRSTQLFINLKDNTRLDSVTYNGVTGFPPIGKIIEGIDVIDSLNSEYGEAPSQDSITVKGREYTERVFPNMDYINKAVITK